MKKVIIISILCIFVLAPILAKVVSDISYNNKSNPAQDPISASKNDILSAIQKDNASRNEGDTYEFPNEVVSVKQMDKWWYIAIVKIDAGEDIGTYDAPVLLSKFTNEKDSLRVVTKPGEDLPYFNISGGWGVPYDVIDELHKSLGDDHAE